VSVLEKHVVGLDEATIYRHLDGCQARGGQQLVGFPPRLVGGPVLGRREQLRAIARLLAVGLSIEVGASPVVVSPGRVVGMKTRRRVHVGVAVRRAAKYLVEPSQPPCLTVRRGPRRWRAVGLIRPSTRPIATRSPRRGPSANFTASYRPPPVVLPIFGDRGQHCPAEGCREAGRVPGAKATNCWSLRPSDPGVDA
jgi:hypothetical protein